MLINLLAFGFVDTNAELKFRKAAFRPALPLNMVTVSYSVPLLFRFLSKLWDLLISENANIL